MAAPEALREMLRNMEKVPGCRMLLALLAVLALAGCLVASGGIDKGRCETPALQS